ncbi:hypothetical protein [Rubellimicrobium arenae]|uniref:hypothetical protein n=1 Tax=Rubellimicrobium arenae TaxID=2817372 RepID=UPI001B301E9B|nr:hypothetical protein [Rubellimicrobium arenae]
MADRFTPAQKRAALVRELGMRRRVYPRWVEAGRMKSSEMHHEIAVLEAILEDYPEQREPDLFTTSRRPHPSEA